MNLRKSALAAAVTATLALGAAGQASAYIYGVANMTIDNLVISITQPNPNPPPPILPAGVVVNNFQFTQVNTALLNGAGALSGATCSGVPLANDCTQLPLGKMDADAVNAPGSSAPLRTNNQSSGGEFAFLGPNQVGNYANSDSQLVTAELVNLGSPTKTHNIAESLLNTASSASASSNLQSITGFEISFVVSEGGPATFQINFDADPDLAAAITGQGPGSYGAQANLAASLTLSKNGGGGFANWTPDGVAQGAGGCNVAAIVTCNETADSEDLNTNVGTNTDDTADLFSWDPGVLTLKPYALTISGLTAGTWTLTLSELKSNQLSQTPVPEPGILALMGLGLVGLFATSRRRKLG